MRFQNSGTSALSPPSELGGGVDRDDLRLRLLVVPGGYYQGTGIARLRPEVTHELLTGRRRQRANFVHGRVRMGWAGPTIIR